MQAEVLYKAKICLLLARNPFPVAPLSSYMASLRSITRRLTVPPLNPSLFSLSRVIPLCRTSSKAPLTALRHSRGQCSVENGSELFEYTSGRWMSVHLPPPLFTDLSLSLSLSHSLLTIKNTAGTTPSDMPNENDNSTSQNSSV